MSNTQLSFGHVGHGLAKDFDPSPSGPVLIMAPTVFPKLAIIGTDEFATPAIWSPRGGGTISVVREFQADGIRVVLNTATAPGTASFGQVFSYLETATETGGFADGTNSVVVAIGTVRGVVPSINTAASIAPVSGPVGTVFSITPTIYDGTSPITVTGTLYQNGVDVTSAMVGLTFTSTVAGPLLWTEAPVNAQGPGPLNGAGATIDVALAFPVVGARVIDNSNSIRPTDLLSGGSASSLPADTAKGDYTA